MSKVEEALRELVQHQARRAASDVISDVPAQLRELQRQIRDLRRSVDQLGSELRNLVAGGRAAGAPADAAEEIGPFSPADLKSMRERFDLTQQELAKLLDVSPVTITAWETGKSRPRQHNLRRIAALCQKEQSEVDAALGRARVPDLCGDDVKRLRTALGLSQMVLAELIGVSAAAVTAWETGKTSPSRENRRALAELAQKPRAEVERELTRSGVLVPQQAPLSAEDIRALRLAAGMSQRDLARKLSVSVNSVSNWETGRTQPRRNSLRQLLELKQS